MEMSLADSAMTREILRDISKRPLDISDLNVSVMHGVIYLRGKIDKIRGYYDDIDLHSEMNVLTKLLRQKQGIRDVVCEVDYGGLSITERVRHPKTRHSIYR
ncbi:MAG: hypothetical protein NT018_03930 [Armatimonadetes bacterium]|nr:hypothetical protein [Armatimonadota bacterium]